MKVCSLCRRCHDDSVQSCTEGHPPLSESRTGSCELVPGYRLEQQLDSGLKGETYRAREKVSGRTCLIKLLPPNEASREQFLYEARLAATLFHPNVADIYEADSLGTGELYVVAEEPEGQTARELLQTTGTPRLLTAIQIVRQAAEAVHALHLKGLIHRAVNPENIVVTSDPAGELLVRIQNPDFGGIAERAIVSNKFLIDTAIGSVRYFAPEQCSGEPENIKTDIYALGVVLYEMIAGVPPFDAQKAAALIQMHRSLPPPEIRIDNFDLRMLLTHTLMESLQKQPRTRQSSANAFARQLRHMEQLATHVSTPPPAGVVPTPPPRPASVNAAQAAAVGTAVAPPAPVVMNVPIAPKPTADQSYVEAVQTVAGRVENEPAPVRPQPLRPALIDVDPVAPVPMIVTAADSPPVSLESTVPVADTSFGLEPAPATHLEGPLDDIPEIPESLADIVQVDEAYEEFAFTQTEQREPEISEAESPRVETRPHTVVESQAAETVQPEMPAVEHAHTEVDVPELAAITPEPPLSVPVLSRADPKKVVWNDLEDDIPSEEDVQAALLAEQSSEPVAESLHPEPVQVEVKSSEVPVVQVEPKKIETSPVRPAPAKVVWEELEDDIPSEEDVQAALLKEQPAPLVSEFVEPEPIRVESKPPEIPIVQPEPQKIETVPEGPEPAKIVFESFDDDIPTEADVEAALSEVPVPEPVAVRQPEPAAARAFLFEEKLQPPAAPLGRVISEPVRSTERRKPVYRPSEDPIFAAYGGRSWPAVNINYRSVLIVVGLLTMAVVFFVGRVVMSDSFAGNGPVKKVEAETVQTRQPLAQAPPQNAVTPNIEPGPSGYESTSPVADDELDAKQLRPITIDESTRTQRQMFYPTPAAKPAGRDETAKAATVSPTVQAPPPAAVSQYVAKPLPFSPSVVIPYKGRQKAKTNDEKDCADQQAPPAQNKTSNRAVNITRPRIVRDPMP